MSKKKRRRRRTTSEKVMVVLGILIAMAMIFGLIVGLGGGRSHGQAPLPLEWDSYDAAVGVERQSAGGRQEFNNIISELAGPVD